MKKLLLTCTDLMAIQFLVPHIRYLSQNGFSVELACSDVGGRLGDLHKALDGIAPIHIVRLVRSPFSLGNRKGYGDLKKIIDGEHWDIIWTNEPVMGVMTRLAARSARKRGTKVVYMVHGFHFYKGAPKKNWLLYYPVEKYCSRLCDMIITINEEDYRMAKTFHAGRVEKIDGIGLDTEKFKLCNVNRAKKREELGIPEDAFFIVSVGELQHRKNHEVLIRAIGKAAIKNIHYGICGRGELFDELQTLANQLKIQMQVHFFGYRDDIIEILHCADLYAHPSMREGLGIAALEAMASGLPLLTSNVGGISDYVKNGVTGLSYCYNDVNGFSEGLRRYYDNPQLRQQIVENEFKIIQKYDIRKVERKVCSLMNMGD